MPQMLSRASDRHRSSPLLRAGRAAMACRFEVLVNPETGQPMQAATSALDEVDRIEDQLSVYRSDSELSELNRTAAGGPVCVEPRLFQLLEQCADLHRATQGAFDITIGPLARCWGFSRRQGCVPDPGELAKAMACVGMDLVERDSEVRTVSFRRLGVELNMGAIGKGHALDRAAEVLAGAGICDVILHGGYSSLLARGSRGGDDGWTVGVRHPLRPGRRLATLRLRNAGLSTSGSGEQFFRHGGRRYCHVLDPRTGQPVEGMLSVTVRAPTAAEADALSTAFFVLGLEGIRDYCARHPDVAALVVPEPQRGGPLDVINVGFAAEELEILS